MDGEPVYQSMLVLPEYCDLLVTRVLSLKDLVKTIYWGPVAVAEHSEA
jgi:hypothetical protein